MFKSILSNRWWKKGLTKPLLCLLLLFSITQVARTQTVKILKAEYFWDADPGVGLGTNIPFTASDTINISPNITTTSAGFGYHTVYVRTLKDSLGFQTWGLTDSKKVYIGNTQNVQLFWDTDPGTAAATIITTNLNDSINITPSIAAPLNAGWHILYTRRVFQNANGTIVPTSLAEPSKLVLVAAPERIEYFWDTDPGVGNGIILNGPGNTIDSINLNYIIPTTGLATGFHKLYIRRNGGGTFSSITDVRDVKILGLTGGEYFIDIDPGVGNGKPFTLGTPVALPTETGDTINANWNWIAGCYAPGPHNMYIRMKDGGVWSLTDSIAFTMLPDNPIITAKNPGPGPNGTPVKITGSNALAPYLYRLLPGGTFGADTIFLAANGSSPQYEMKDSCGTLRQITVNTPATPTSYVSTNARGGTDLEGFRYFVYFRDSTNLNNIMVAVKDNDLWLGHVGVNTYFSSGAVATSFNTNTYLKRSFRIQTQLNPVGTKRVRLFISQAEFTALQAADPTSFPNGINSLTITKYTGPQEDSLFNPLPGGSSIIIPNSAITIATVGSMYSLEFDVNGFSGFYIGGNNSSINLCPGSNITIPSDVSGSAYQWQLDSGSGFANFSDGTNYSGTNTSSLQIMNAPTTFSKYKYRCVVTTGGGPVYSQVYTLGFTVSWVGTTSSAWENPANWSCGAIPDGNTDVFISVGKPNNPILNSIRSIHSLKLNPGAVVTIAPGFRLNITGP